MRRANRPEFYVAVPQLEPTTRPAGQIASGTAGVSTPEGRRQRSTAAERAAWPCPRRCSRDPIYVPTVALSRRR